MSIVARVESLKKVYGLPGTAVCVEALRGVDLDFIAGQSVAVCGQSGSGKSTLMNIIGCLDRPTDGRYLLGDIDVSSMSDDDLSDVRGQKIGFVFQNFNLIPALTVLENLEVPLFYQGVSPAQRRARAAAAIELVGLADRGQHRPVELSGGQQQRVAIARALINEPLILLADEPTGNLDTATGEAILAIFDRLHDQGVTILMVTHEPEVAQRCDRIITLRDGRIVSDELRNEPERPPALASAHAHAHG
ncbi:MAG: ABC transporter ATP-binding protein [Phycisphaerales bacterium]|nr:ABC transporter ATP-binding protein [Phycisphaerales bacterium]